MYYIMSSVENLNKIFLEFCDDLENVVSDKKDFIDNARNRVKEKPSTKYYLEYFFRPLFRICRRHYKMQYKSIGEYEYDSWSKIWGSVQWRFAVTITSCIVALYAYILFIGAKFP